MRKDEEVVFESGKVNDKNHGPHEMGIEIFRPRKKRSLESNL